MVAYSQLYINFTYLAPLCPTPPDAPIDGQVEYTPKLIEMIPEESCGLDSEDIPIVCPSFLRCCNMNTNYILQ